nr:transposase [candidate division Zixibacteria bacterium]
MEVGIYSWIGFSQKARERTVLAGDFRNVKREIELAKRRFGLSGEARVLSCYEAGRDGFWLHRYLIQIGVRDLVVDSSSIEVNRRAKRTKTDKMDLGKLLAMLMRYDQGERTRHTNRIKGLLTSYGVRMRVRGVFLDRLETRRLWDGSPIPIGLKKRLVREYGRLKMVNRQIEEFKGERADLIKTSESSDIEMIRQLLTLRGIGPNSSWLYVMEFFGWRGFRNYRQVRALAGLTPTPYQSGDGDRERGISKAGNRYVR